MNRFLDIVRKKGLSFENGIDYDEFISNRDDANAILKAANPKVLDEMIFQVSSIVSDHMSAYFEAFCDVIPADVLVRVFAKHIYCENKHRRMMVLDLIELTEHEECLELFDTNKVISAQDVSRYTSVIIALLKRHPDLVTQNKVELLRYVYESNVASHIKYEIWKFSQSIELGLPKYQDFVDLDYEKLMRQQPQLIKRAHQHFKDKKFNSALKILQRYRKEDLSALGRKVLLMSERAIIDSKKGM